MMKAIDGSMQFMQEFKFFIDLGITLPGLPKLAKKHVIFQDLLKLKKDFDALVGMPTDEVEIKFLDNLAKPYYKLKKRLEKASQDGPNAELRNSAKKYIDLLNNVMKLWGKGAERGSPVSLTMLRLIYVTEMLYGNKDVKTELEKLAEKGDLTSLLYLCLINIKDNDLEANSNLIKFISSTNNPTKLEESLLEQIKNQIKNQTKNKNPELVSKIEKSLSLFNSHLMEFSKAEEEMCNLIRRQEAAVGDFEKINGFMKNKLIDYSIGCLGFVTYYLRCKEFDNALECFKNLEKYKVELRELDISLLDVIHLKLKFLEQESRINREQKEAYYNLTNEIRISLKKNKPSNRILQEESINKDMKEVMAKITEDNIEIELSNFIEIFLKYSLETAPHEKIYVIMAFVDIASKLFEPNPNFSDKQQQDIIKKIMIQAIKNDSYGGVCYILNTISNIKDLFNHEDKQTFLETTFAYNKENYKMLSILYKYYEDKPLVIKYCLRMAIANKDAESVNFFVSNGQADHIHIKKIFGNDHYLTHKSSIPSKLYLEIQSEISKDNTATKGYKNFIDLINDGKSVPAAFSETKNDMAEIKGIKSFFSGKSLKQKISDLATELSKQQSENLHQGEKKILK